MTAYFKKEIINALINATFIYKNNKSDRYIFLFIIIIIIIHGIYNEDLDKKVTLKI